MMERILCFIFIYFSGFETELYYTEGNCYMLQDSVSFYKVLK